jgi:mono/diheme cytochrome c family protein
MMRTLVILFSLAAAFALSPATALAGDAAAGQAVFMANCMSCHGMTGKGDGPVGAALQPPPRDFSVGDFKYDANGDGTPGEDADLRLIIQKANESWWK